MFESTNSLGTTQYAGLQMGANGTVYFNVPGTRLTFGIDPDATVELKRLNFSLGVAPSVGSCTGLAFPQEAVTATGAFRSNRLDHPPLAGL